MRNIWSRVGVLALAAWSVAPAAAQTSIGGAVAVQNEVRGETQGKTLTIARNDRVYQNERVRTGASSLAKLILLDQTNVALGPTSQITLDKFVYDAEAGAKQVTISAVKGAFRFMSGTAPHEAYEVRTPQATIGVRGTIYDVKVEGGRTTVVLQDGAVHVCRLGTQSCADLLEPGQSLVVSDKGIEGPIDPANKTWDFGSYCGATSAGDLCGRTTQFAFNDAKPAPAHKARAQKAVLRDSEPRPRAAAPPHHERVAAVKSHRKIKRVRYIEFADEDDEIIMPQRPSAFPIALGGAGLFRAGSFGSGFGPRAGRGNIGFRGR
jgi:hypothetical protein